MKPLFLVGYMGCGKSTLGRKLARRLGIGYADTDALVEEREGASVSDVFRYEGEQRFREVEREVLDRVIDEGAVPVVSTGGGLPTWGDNMARMNAAGCTVYLRRSAEQIARIRAHFDAQAAEMEGGAIAQVCLRNGVGCVSVKSVSDHLFSDTQAEEYFDFGQALEKL